MSSLDPRNNAFVMSVESTHASVAIFVFNNQTLFNAIQHNVLLLVVEFCEGFCERNLVFLGNRFKHPVEVLRMR